MSLKLFDVISRQDNCSHCINVFARLFNPEKVISLQVFERLRLDNTKHFGRKSLNIDIPQDIPPSLI